MVGVAHFVEDASSSDLYALPTVIRHRLLLLLAHLVVVSHSIHLTLIYNTEITEGFWGFGEIGRAHV